jgi:hypothetical protein
VFQAQFVWRLDYLLKYFCSACTKLMRQHQTFFLYALRFHTLRQFMESFVRKLLL